MKLVTINNSLLFKYHEDPEVLQKSTRPYVLVIRLKYRNTNYDFAIPIRSNIPASAPKNQYFALPPRPQTRPKTVMVYITYKCFLPQSNTLSVTVQISPTVVYPLYVLQDDLPRSAPLSHHIHTDIL